MNIMSILHILPKIGLIILIIGIVFLLLFLFCPIKYDVRVSNIDCLKASLHSEFIFKMLCLDIFLKKKERLITKIKLYLFGRLLWQSGLRSGKKPNPPPTKPIEASDSLPVSEKPEIPSEKKSSRKEPIRRIKISETEEKSVPKESHASKDTDFSESEDDSVLKKILKMPDKGKLIKAFIKLIKDLFKELKPDYIYLRAKLGTGDPCQTGKYTGIAYAVSGFIGADAEITPDFENTVLEGKLRLTGSFFSFRIIYIGLRFILQKPVRNFIKIIKKG